MAIGFLVARIEERVQRKRTVVRRRQLLLDQRTHNARFDLGQVKVHEENHSPKGIKEEILNSESSMVSGSLPIGRRCFTSLCLKSGRMTKETRAPQVHAALQTAD